MTWWALGSGPMVRSVLAVVLLLGCEEPAAAARPSASVTTSLPEVASAPVVPAPIVPPTPIEIQACAPLEDGELRLLDVDPHTAARLIAIARRTAVVAAGAPERGCTKGCRDISLRGPADADLATVGFEVTSANGVLVAGPRKIPARALADGGSAIDIEQERASFADLAALLAGPDSIDDASVARLTGELTIVSRNVPSRRLLDAAAALGGGRLRARGKRIVLEGVRGVPSVGRMEIENCAAPVCPVVAARCSDARQLRLVAVLRRTPLRPLPQPVELGQGLRQSDTTAFVEDASGRAWHVRVGDLLGRPEAGVARDAGESTSRRVEAITCGTVTLDDGSTITRGP